MTLLYYNSYFIIYMNLDILKILHRRSTKTWSDVLHSKCRAGSQSCVWKMNARQRWQIPLINLIPSFFLSDSSESIQHQFTWSAICEIVAAVVILESSQPTLDRRQSRQFALVLNTCFVFTSVLAHLEPSRAQSDCRHRSGSTDPNSPKSLLKNHPS